MRAGAGPGPKPPGAGPARDRRADLAIAVVVLIWGANFSVVKAALADFHPLAFNSLRFVLASVLLAIPLAARGPGVPFARRDWLPLLGLGVLGNTLYQVLFIYGIDWTLAGNASLMLSTVPAFAALLSVWMGHERVGAGAWAGILASFVGIALVVWGGARAVAFGASTVRGDLAMLGAAVGWSVYTVGSSPLVRRYGALRVTATTMWIGTVGLLLLSVPSLGAQDWGAVRPAAWVGLAYSGALAIALAYALWYFSVGRVGSSRTAIYSNAIPIVAIGVAWPALGEVPTLLQLAGAAAILGGITLARLARVEPGPAERLPPE